MRRIIHVDLDAFFASVEELLDPSIAGLPIIVGGDPAQRGVVSSASYAARAFGVRSAMPMSQALRLCPQAIVRHGHYREYHEVQKLFRETWNTHNPLRLLGVSVSGLAEQPAHQLSLFGNDDSRWARLSHALDEIQKRYGEHAIRRASLLGPEDEPDGMASEESGDTISSSGHNDI